MITIQDSCRSRRIRTLWLDKWSDQSCCRGALSRAARRTRGLGCKTEGETPCQGHDQAASAAPEAGASCSAALWVPHLDRRGSVLEETSKANKIPINRFILYNSKVFHNHQVVFQYFTYSSAACTKVPFFPGNEDIITTMLTQLEYR